MAASAGEHRPTKTVTWSTHCSWTGELQKARELIQMLDIPDHRLLSRNMCGILIHIRIRRFFPFLMPGLQHGQHRYLSTVIWLWSPMFDNLVSTYDDIIGCCWSAFEPSRENARTSCKEGSLWNHLLVTMMLEQTMHHIVDDCPLRLFANGLSGLCAMSDETVEYLFCLDLNL
jgi:hypothetical protein